jgi:hypothetical protein
MATLIITENASQTKDLRAAFCTHRRSELFLAGRWSRQG